VRILQKRQKISSQLSKRKSRADKERRMQHRAADRENKRKALADKEKRMQHPAADRESKRRSLVDEGRRMQHRAAVRACQAQRQKYECYREKNVLNLFPSVRHIDYNMMQHIRNVIKLYAIRTR